MNTLSAIFVHCLPKDGSFLKAENLDFCNFSPHFRPHALPPELPTFSPFQGATSTAKFPLILPQKSPSAHPFRGIASQPTFPLIFSRILSTIFPFRGILWGDFGVKSWKYFRNSDDSWTNFSCLGQRTGAVRWNLWEYVQELFREDLWE